MARLEIEMKFLGAGERRFEITPRLDVLETRGIPSRSFTQRGDKDVCISVAIFKLPSNKLPFPDCSIYTTFDNAEHVVY